jgi:hypothetical protein
MTEIEKAWEAGYRVGQRDGRYEQYRADRERFEAETEALRAQNTKILEYVANLESMKPYTIALETK